MRFNTLSRCTAIVLLLLLALSSVDFILSTNAQAAPEARDIQILADGTVLDSDPVTPLIQSGDKYTFSGDICGRIDILRGGVTLDGAGYSLIKGDLDFAVRVGNTDKQSRINGATIENLRIVGFHYAITLLGIHDMVSNVTVTGGTDYNGVGIWVEGSMHVVEGCSIVGNYGMGILVNANATTISNNTIADNGNFGVYFYDTAGILRNNIFRNNTAGPFHMEENELTHAGQPFRINSDSIDSSNMVDNKPVYYWVNETNRIVPRDAGYVVLDRCTNITVDGLSICRNAVAYPAYSTSAINLIRSSNILVQNCKLDHTGIWCSYSSHDITLSHNTLLNACINSYAPHISILMNAVSFPNRTAIILGGSDATVARNNLFGCDGGIRLESCKSSLIIQNVIEDCKVGVDIFSSTDITVKKNNFVNNVNQVTEQHSALEWPLSRYYQSLNTTWNGNYWSNYNGTDVNRDGVGDTPYVIFENMTDYQPLMAPFDISRSIPNLPQGSAPPLPSPSTSIPPTSTSATVEAVDTQLPVASTLVAVLVVAGVAGAVLAVLALRLISKKKMPFAINTQQVV